MTKKDFRQLMRCGRGKCVQELETASDKEKYRDMVLWACTHDFSFDYQCEGSRGFYAYQLAKCYDDADFFLDADAGKFRKLTFDSDWIFAHLTDLLECFAKDGNVKAKIEIENKYNQLYNEMIGSRSRKDSCNFEIVAEALVNIGVKTKFGITEDENNLISNNKNYDKDDFFNLQGEIELQTYDSPLCSLEEFISGKGLSFFVGKQIEKYGDGAELKIANAVLSETDKKIKKHLLKVFRHCQWPLDAQILIDYSTIDGELSETAFSVLEKTKDGKVREYALSLIKQGENIESAVSMLIANYKKCDRDLLVESVEKIGVGDNSDNFAWHGVQMQLIDEFERKTDDLPDELLIYIYENTLCACCRRDVLKLMQSKGLLTDKIARECRYDSFEDIRTLVG